MKPFIGVCTKAESTLQAQQLDLAYMRALELAGARPIMISPISDYEISELLKTMNGLILMSDATPLTGESEQSPDGKQISEENNADIEQELQLVRQAIQDTNRPVLGVGRGCLLINEILGGKLRKRKLRDNDEQEYRKVNFTPGTRLAQIYGQAVQSIAALPHEEIERLGENIVCSARADDGVIEAIEVTGERLIIGVQWHPAEDMKAHFPLIKALVTATLCHEPV